MQKCLRYFAPIIASAATFAALAAAPVAGAQTNPTLPQCVGTGGAAVEGQTTTECSSPGNVQINSTPMEPTYAYPWDDEFYGPALIIGGGNWGNHGAGGGGGHGGR
jgi:hypothetical protein